MKWFLAVIATLAPLCAQCSYSVGQSVFNVGAGATVGSITGATTITAAAGCAWTATTSASWLHVNVGQSGTGNGSVAWSVDRNTLPSARTGTIVVAGQTITINQAAAICDYAIAPASANIGVTGGSGTFQVKTSCSWGAFPTQSWITVPPNTGGIVDGPVNYTVAANPCVAARSGSILAGLNSTQYQLFQLTQDGSPNNLVLSPTALTVSSGAADGTVNVTTGSGCGWTASSDTTWLQITSQTSGSGTGVLGYHVLANSSSQRTGTIHVGSATFTITQLSVPAPVPQLTAMTNAASGAQGAISPGEIISLFGSNLGPVAGVGAQLTTDGQSVTKTLGSVQVSFDGVLAALTYSSANQVNVVVPYSVAGKTSTQVQVQYQATSSNILTAPLQAAAPGIFTLDSSGLGPGAILNQDYSVNSSANRAAQGSVVQIYCTGGGVTDPASIDAAITGLRLPLLTQTVSVTIGGVTAPVLYSGGAPGSVAGLTQINAQVPSGLTPGPAIGVVVQIGNWQSQSGVTLGIR